MTRGNERGTATLPDDLAGVVPGMAGALSLLDDWTHLVVSVAGSRRYVQFAAYGPNLRAETVGNAWLPSEQRVTPVEHAWLVGHGWNEPDEGGNYWRHFEPASHYSAAAAAIITLHAIHGVQGLAELVIESEAEAVVDEFERGLS